MSRSELNLLNKLNAENTKCVLLSGDHNSILHLSTVFTSKYMYRNVLGVLLYFEVTDDHIRVR